jgi:hypothetical protein
MGERKEQDEIKSIFLQAGPSRVLSDEEYIGLGWALSRADDELSTPAYGEVVGLPATRSPRETLVTAWSLLGRLPKSLMHALGLEKRLVPIVIRNLRPRCPTCKAIAQRPIDLSFCEIPEEGFVALVIRDGAQEASLEERCELLGVERAYVDGKLVRGEEVSGRNGEPVLRLFSAARAAEERGAIDEWFARGGGPLVVMHVPSREAQGRELGVLSGGWRCPTCNQGMAAPSVSDLYEPEPCGRCRGEGWLLVENARLCACEECDGFGSTAPIGEAQLGPVMLRHGAVLTTEDLLREDFELSCEESQMLHLLQTAGLGRYPLGAPLALLSSAERVLVATVSARLSAIKGLICAVDAPAVGLMNGLPGRDAWAQVSDPTVFLYEPAEQASPRELPQESTCECIELRDVCAGPIAAERLSFPIRAASLVQTTAQAGIPLLFEEIERRFSQRRKRSQVCSFGDIKRCCRVDCHQTDCDSVLGLLGLEQELAQEIARSQVARQLGFSVEDLDLSKGRYRCRECLASESRTERESCDVCRGTLYDWRVSHLPIGKRSLGEVMRGSLEEARNALWAHDVAEAVLSRVPGDLRTRLSLATDPAEIAPAERRFLVACGALAHIPFNRARASKRGSLDTISTLVLLEGAFATSRSYQELVLDLIEEALGAGATVLCSEAPQALESCFRSVVRLSECQVRSIERLQSRFMDRRLTRWLRIV